MISANGVSLSFGQRILFKDVNLKFVPGNCYGLIGANGTGKSTFLKILAGEIEPDHGEIAVTPGERVAVLRQNQFEFDDVPVLRTVLMGNKPLYDIIVEKEYLYSKDEMSDDDGMRASELETIFAEMNGWDAESQAAEMLSGLGVTEAMHQLKMRELEAGFKVRVLLCQALFGNPEILLLDEPTNNLDIGSIMWLEEFLCEFQNTVVIVSHDRHFLDKVCTHIADIDFGSINFYTGNYSFWYEASQLALQQKRDQNRKAEDKIAQLKTFIERFSANASKSRQATARKKMLDKLSFEEIKPSSRKYPHLYFQEEREAGKDLLTIENLSASIDGRKLFSGLDLNVTKGEKIAFVGKDAAPASALFRILSGVAQPDNGSFRWGVTTIRGDLPKDNTEFFATDLSLIDWLRQYARGKDQQDEEFIRGYLGRLLFTGEEAKKSVQVLSGGEKVRCMLARIMLMRPNVLVFDEPTNHLDLESITALNNSLIEFKGTVLFTSQDRQFVDTIANRVVEITPKGRLDKSCSFSEYLEDPKLLAARAALY